MQTYDGHQTWHGQIDSSGRVLIPSSTRHAMGWEPGTPILLESDGHSLRMLTMAEFTQEVQREFGPWKQGEPLLSEQLIAERQAEAVRERRP